MTHYIILFILWLCFWSFSTVLISRWKSWKWWIMLWRSECPHCKNTLSATELIPVFSWLIQWWKCKNCSTHIPTYYPLSELIMWGVFVLMWWISSNLGYPIPSTMTLILLFWWFVTVIYIIYDIRYMEIPDQILVPGILITLWILLIWYIEEKYVIFFDIGIYQNFHTFLTDHILAAILVYSFFFLQILIPGSIYLIKHNRSPEILGLLMSYITFPIVIIIDLIRWPTQQTWEDEIPVWIWGWDLRIALFIWLTLGTIHSLSTLMFAYIIGSIVWISMLSYWKIKKQKISHMIPFGPFLWIGWFLSLIFYSDIIKYFEAINI